MDILVARKMYLDSPDRLLDESCPSADSLSDFIRNETPRGAIGLSGGVDSALVAHLAVRAIGKENVFGLILPAGNVSLDEELAGKLAAGLGIDCKKIELGALSRTAEGNSDLFRDKVDSGNLKARLRMIHLYALARKIRGSVLGTGNRTEAMIGYFTKFGDGGVDLLPIGRLYKRQVWKMSRELGVPEEIVERTPTAGLWPGQTDEGEIGIRYEDLDRIILGLDIGMSDLEIMTACKVEGRVVAEVKRRRTNSEHKRLMPPVPGPTIESPDERTKSSSPAISDDPGERPEVILKLVLLRGERYVLEKTDAGPSFISAPLARMSAPEDVLSGRVRELTGLDLTIKTQVTTIAEPDFISGKHQIVLVYLGSVGKSVGFRKENCILASGKKMPALQPLDSMIWEST